MLASFVDASISLMMPFCQRFCSLDLSAQPLEFPYS
jgi:hypothetical protein